ALADAPVELGRDDVPEARPAHLLQRLAHDLLALAGRVHLGVVEEVHAGVPRGRHALARGGSVELIAVRHPRAEGKLAHLEAGAAESPVFHVQERTEKGVRLLFSAEKSNLTPFPGFPCKARRRTSSCSPAARRCSSPTPSPSSRSAPSRATRSPRTSASRRCRRPRT